MTIHFNTLSVGTVAPRQNRLLWRRKVHSTKEEGEFSCPSKGSSGACEPPAAAVASPERVANHGVQQTVGTMSLQAAAADDRPLWMMMLLLWAASQP